MSEPIKIRLPFRVGYRRLLRAVWKAGPVVGSAVGAVLGTLGSSQGEKTTPLVVAGTAVLGVLIGWCATRLLMRLVRLLQPYLGHSLAQAVCALKLKMELAHAVLHDEQCALDAMQWELDRLRDGSMSPPELSVDRVRQFAGIAARVSKPSAERRAYAAKVEADALDVLERHGVTQLHVACPAITPAANAALRLLQVGLAKTRTKIDVSISSEFANSGELAHFVAGGQPHVVIMSLLAYESVLKGNPPRNYQYCAPLFRVEEYACRTAEGASRGGARTLLFVAGSPAEAHAKCLSAGGSREALNQDELMGHLFNLAPDEDALLWEPFPSWMRQEHLLTFDPKDRFFFPLSLWCRPECEVSDALARLLILTWEHCRAKPHDALRRVVSDERYLASLSRALSLDKFFAGLYDHSSS